MKKNLPTTVMQLCEGPTWPENSVIVVDARRAAPPQIVSPELLPSIVIVTESVEAVTWTGGTAIVIDGFDASRANIINGNRAADCILTDSAIALPDICHFKLLLHRHCSRYGTVVLERSCG
jgi:hypothetical protein